MGALCSPSPTGNFFSKVFLDELVLTLPVTVGKDCTAVLFLNKGENFIVICPSTEVDSFFCFSMPQCVVKIVTSSFWSASVASKLFRPTAVDACRQVMKTLQFHKYFASSSLPNNTDYKAVETSWILCLSTWFQIIGHKKCNSVKRCFVGSLERWVQWLGKFSCFSAIGWWVREVTLAFALVGINPFFCQEVTHHCTPSDHAYFHPFRWHFDGNLWKLQFDKLLLFLFRPLLALFASAGWTCLSFWLNFVRSLIIKRLNTNRQRKTLNFKDFKLKGF